jgi:DNA-binding SARP family transcriptional activator
MLEMGGVCAGVRLRFALFGPVRAWRGGEQLDLGAARQRAVLAVLLLHANRPVERGRLIEAVWGDPAPAYAVNQLHKYVSAVRRALVPDKGARSSSAVLRWSDGGYVLKVEPDGLDLAVFERQVVQGRSAHAQAKAAQLREALRLWNGPPLMNVSSVFLGTRSAIGWRS